MDKDNNIKNVPSSLYDISTKIKLLRISKGLSQERLGNLVGVTKATISNYEKDACFPSIEALYRLAIALDVSSDELLGLSNKNFEEIDYDKLLGEIVNISNLSKKDQNRIVDLIKRLGE